MSHTPQRKHTIRKYKAIQERYDELFNKKRMRHDDVIKQLMEEFFIATDTTIYRILGTEV